MVKHTQIIRRQKRMSYVSVFDHSVGLALKGLKHDPAHCNPVPHCSYNCSY